MAIGPQEGVFWGRIWDSPLYSMGTLRCTCATVGQSLIIFNPLTMRCVYLSLKQPIIGRVHFAVLFRVESSVDPGTAVVYNKGPRLSQ